MIKRDLYLQRLIDRMNNGSIKVITGIRRCGKSVLLFDIFGEYLLQQGVAEGHIIKFAFDSEDDLEKIGENMLDLAESKRKVDPHKFSAYIKSKLTDDGKYYLLLDEVQQLGSFEAVLNGYLYKKNLDVYVTGSNSKFLSSDIITEFRGRGDEIRVYPLSFSEFYSVYGGEFDKAWAMYCNYGGMPLCLSMETMEDKAKYLTSLFETTYLADIINRNNLRGNAKIGELTDVLASSIGSLTNPLKLSNTFASVKNVKLTANTISAYIDYLQDAFLIEKAVRYDIKGKKNINTPAKYYFVDMGLRNARLAFRQQEYAHIMENVIYNELRLRGYSVDMGVVENIEKENGSSVRKKLEVDFVLNLGNRRYYVQSAYNIPDEAKMTQEQASLLAINDAFRKIIIVNQPILSGYNEQGILLISLQANHLLQKINFLL